jgi:hypothetical protein
VLATFFGLARALSGLGRVCHLDTPEKFFDVKKMADYQDMAVPCQEEFLTMDLSEIPPGVTLKLITI